MSKEKSVIIPDKTKGFFALGTVAAVLLWMFLWYMFPMEFYAIFFNNIVGSNIQLILLASVLSIPMCYIFSKFTKKNIPLLKTLLVNILFLVGLDYVYSIFYDMHFIFVILTGVLHFAVILYLFGHAESKESKNETIPIKKQPLMIIIWAAVYVLIIDISNIMLFRLITYIYHG